MAIALRLLWWLYLYLSILQYEKYLKGAIFRSPEAKIKPKKEKMDNI